MALFTDEALVLDCYPYQDRHVILALLSREHGVVRGVLRRARGAKAPHGAATQVLSRLRVEVYQRYGAELATIRQVDLLTSSFPLVAKSLQQAATGAAVAELLLTFCPPAEPAHLSYRLGVALLDGLLSGVDPSIALAYGQLWTILLAGLLPPLDSCAGCGAELDGGCALRSTDAHPLCRCCAAADADTLSLDSLHFLAACRRLPLPQVRGEVPADCARWLDRLCRIEADRPLRALGFLRQHGGV